ncbi:ABC transporter permease [Streptomyces sp. BI20]|uniref:ABC transporter permease n=1 Tax=Streptomyces sp. BI20 TaxID=3403460 RepID=UPI003C73D5F3
MRLYSMVALGGFRRYATYGAATAAGCLANVVFGFITAYTYVALWGQRAELGGYDRAQAVTFVWVTQALLASVSLLGGGFETELQERIRTGDVAVDLCRPADLQAWWLAADLGRAVFQLLGRGLVPLACGALVFELALPGEVGRWVLFAVAWVLALVVSFALRFVVGLLAFWLLDGAGVNVMASVLTLFFSGMVVPLTLFPGVFGELVRVLPWAAMLQVPVDVLLGTNGAAGGVAGAVRSLGFQAVWAVVLLGLGRMVQAAATRRVVVQGG